MKKKKIDPQTLKFWNEVRPDVTLDWLQAETGKSVSTLSHAFTEKKATQDTITRINNAMLKKQKELKLEKIPA